MSALSANSTVAQAFHQNATLHNVALAEGAWRELMQAVSQANQHTKRMHLLNLSNDGEDFKAEFIVELSDWSLSKTVLTYNLDDQSLKVESTLDRSKDGHGLGSAQWATVEDGPTRTYADDYTLEDIAEGILSSNTEMAYQALYRANSKLYPMHPTMDMLHKLEAAI